MRFLLALLACAHLPAFAASETPEAAAQAFYRWVLSYQGGALPSPEQRKQLRRLLTPNLSSYSARSSPSVSMEYYPKRHGPRKAGHEYEACSELY